MTTPASPARGHGVLWLALLAHLILATGYAWLTPAFEGPDETDHAYHAAYLSHRRSLPRIKNSGRTPAEKWDEVSTGHHPPLYYAVLATTMHLCGMPDTVPTWSFVKDVGEPTGAAPTDKDASALVVRHGHDERRPRSAEQRLFLALRLWSVLFGSITVVLTYLLGRVAVPGRPAVADTAALLLACNPQWSFQHGVLDNGNLATMFTHAAVLAMALALRANRLGLVGGIGIGFLCGCALLTKLNSLTLLPLLAAALGWLWWRAAGRDARFRLLHGAVAAGVVIAGMTGWFFWRNAQLYDGDFLGQQAHRDAFATNRIPGDMVWSWLTGNYLPLLFDSSIGNLGWNSVAPPRPWTLGALGLVALGLVGWLWAGVRRLRGTPLVSRPMVLWLLVLVALFGFALVTKFNIDFFQPQGRYLFPAFGSLMVLLASGLSALVAGIEPAGATARRARRVIWLMLPVLAGGYLWLHARPALRFEPVTDEHYTSWTTGLVRGGQSNGVLTILGDAPDCRWQDSREPDPTRRYAVTVFENSGRILIDTHWMAPNLELRDHWSIAPAYLQALPTTTELWWRVREVPNRARGQNVSEMPCSEARRLLLPPR